MRRRVKQPSIKMNLDPIPDELKDFKKLEKKNPREQYLQKSIMHGKGDIENI